MAAAPNLQDLFYYALAVSVHVLFPVPVHGPARRKNATTRRPTCAEQSKFEQRPPSTSMHPRVSTAHGEALAVGPGLGTSVKARHRPIWDNGNLRPALACCNLIMLNVEMEVPDAPSSLLAIFRLGHSSFDHWSRAADPAEPSRPKSRGFNVLWSPLSDLTVQGLRFSRVKPLAFASPKTNKPDKLGIRVHWWRQSCASGLGNQAAWPVAIW
ncbi:hypothetical protein NOR_06749 [Metarhizium rileyi]|uniref:Uncharacterized protein n=1 Tax=Metarhizium rileyi (strain RCEF 4871) TaxID=1649241 RepID=A0A166ZY31_METRR|nr:hypothetical protein NOR_06749 [Metarhizium rileyi RCEF 4871]